MRTGSDDPILITATAGTYAEAQTLADMVSAELQPLLPGSNSRVAASAIAEPGSPLGGVLQIRVGPANNGD